MFAAFAFVFVVGLPALLFPATLHRLALGILSADPEVFLVVGTFLTSLFAHVLLKRTKTYRFFSTHQHEHAHLLFSLLMFSAPQGFASSADHGGIYRGENPKGPLPDARRFLISIAPYWFSPLLFVPVLSCFAGFPASNMGRVAIAWVAGIALVLPISQIHRRQPDFREFGFVPSVCAALWFWCAQTVVLLATLSTWSLSSVPRLYLTAWDVLWRI